MNSLYLIFCLGMAGGDKDKGNRKTKLESVSARRENAEVNPHVKRFYVILIKICMLVWLFGA
jgi:hypothetical protein